MVISALPFISKAGHALSTSAPRAMLTPRVSSSMVTSPLASQSPTQAISGGVGVGEPVSDATSVTVGVTVGNRRRPSGSA